MPHGRPFHRAYSDAQRDAILKSVLVDGVSIAETRRRAESGQLGVPAFEIPYPSAADIVRRERDSFEQRSPDALRRGLEQDGADLGAMARQMVRDLKAQKGEIDPVRLRNAIGAWKAARDALEPKTTGKPQKPQVAGNGNGAQNGDDVLSRLIGG